MATLTRSAARRAAASAAACLPGLLASASCGDLAVKGVFSFITKCPGEWECVYACCASSCKKANSLSMYPSRSSVMNSTCLSSSADCVSPHFQSLRIFSCIAFAPWRSPGYNEALVVRHCPVSIATILLPNSRRAALWTCPRSTSGSIGLAVDAAVSLPRPGPDGGPVHPVAQVDEKDRRRPAVCPPATPGRGPLCHLLLFGMAANTLLTKGYNNKTMDRKERILAKLFTR